MLTDAGRGDGSRAPVSRVLEAGEDPVEAARDAVGRSRAHGYAFALLYMTAEEKAGLAAGDALAPLADEGVRVTTTWAEDATRLARGEGSCAFVMLRWGAVDPFAPPAPAVASTGRARRAKGAGGAKGSAKGAGDAEATEVATDGADVPAGKPGKAAKGAETSKVKAKAKAKAKTRTKDGAKARARPARAPAPGVGAEAP